MVETKWSIIHVLTFSSDPEVEAGRKRPMNKTTYWDRILECYLADDVLQIVRKSYS